MHSNKEFESFSEGVKEILSIVPYVKTYIGEEGLGYTDKGVYQSLSDKVVNKFPSILNPDYPATMALSINAREVGFKTEGSFSFGWRYKISKDTGKLTYGFRVSFTGTSSTVTSMYESKLAEAGWEQFPIKITHEQAKHKGKVKKS